MQSIKYTITMLLVLFSNTIYLEAEESSKYYNPYIHIAKDQINKEKLPQDIPKLNASHFKIKEPTKRKLSNQDIKKSQNVMNKAFQGFFASGLYLNGAIGRDTSSINTIINSYNQDFDTEKDRIMLSGEITNSKPVVFNGGMGYRIFNISYLRGFRIEGQYYYSIFNEKEKYNQYLVFYSAIPLNNLVSNIKVSQKTISMGGTLYYDIFLFKDNYLFVPYVGIGYHKNKRRFKQETTYANRRNNGILTLDNETMQVSIKSQDISASVGLSLLNGYIYGEYIFTKQIGDSGVNISNIKLGLRLPL